VRRALAALFNGAISKDVVSRVGAEPHRHINRNQRASLARYRQNLAEFDKNDEPVLAGRE
jgi:hypothetical protein